LKALIKLAILAPVVLAAGVLFSCTSNTVDQVLEYTEDGVVPVRITIGVTYEFTEGGLTKNTLYAARAEQFQTPDSSYNLLSGGFQLNFYDEAQVLDGRLTAKKGFISGDNSMMIARDSVVFVNKVGETLYTEELIWVQDSAVVYTNKFVTIERADDIIYGKGLVSDERFTNYVIKDPTGIFYLKEDTP
jgi:LPS export ABC transporter protein LptC